VSFGGYAPTTVGVALLHLYSVSGLVQTKAETFCLCRDVLPTASAETSTARLHPAGSRSDQLATVKQGYIRRALWAPRCIAASSCLAASAVPCAPLRCEGPTPPLPTCIFAHCMASAAVKPRVCIPLFACEMWIVANQRRSRSRFVSRGLPR